MSTQAILVTGGCGFIGSHIVRSLVDQGERVVVFDNLSAGSRDHLPPGVTLFEGDITQIADLDRVLAEHSIEAIIHCAALVNAAESVAKKDEYLQVNAQGSRNVWQTAVAAGVKHFLYASSAAVYGTPPEPKPLPESTAPHPSNPYGESKLMGELSLQELVEGHGNYLAFRFFNVGGAIKSGRLGQNRNSRAIMQRLYAASAGHLPEIEISGHDYETADGTVVRDFVHVQDLAKAFILGLAYLRRGGESRILNLGSGQPNTIGEVIRQVAAVTGRPLPLVYGPRLAGDISFSLSDISEAREVLGWTPEHSLTQIVQDGWHSYLTRYGDQL